MFFPHSAWFDSTHCFDHAQHRELVERHREPVERLRDLRSKGFTLIEIVVTIVLVGIVTGIAAMIIMQGAQSYSIEQSRGEAHQQARFALERMAREIRLIRSRTASDISTWNNVALEYFDINGTQIGFQLSGGNIQRRENGGAWQTLATGISTPGADFFTYFDTTGNPPAVVTSLWTVQIDLIAAQGLETLTLRTTVHPRNF
ncbi:MAG TPA: prepilin-type N-terminal cleavage/methylation domain-containing protein [Nitrospirota bacterium]|nr:prepilin-type N-terminal cleavage/methylation domain-containing protein [Nitrospirota bacterium]